RLREGAPPRGHDANRVRVHPAAHQPQREPGWRAATLPCRACRQAVGTGRAAAPRATGSGRQCRTVDLTPPQGTMLREAIRNLGFQRSFAADLHFVRLRPTIATGTDRLVDASHRGGGLFEETDNEGAASTSLARSDLRSRR